MEFFNASQGIFHLQIIDFVFILKVIKKNHLCYHTSRERAASTPDFAFLLGSDLSSDIMR
jgi:hypothetical protein